MTGLALSLQTLPRRAASHRRRMASYSWLLIGMGVFLFTNHPDAITDAVEFAHDNDYADLLGNSPNATIHFGQHNGLARLHLGQRVAEPLTQASVTLLWDGNSSFNCHGWPSLTLFIATSTCSRVV